MRRSYSALEQLPGHDDALEVGDRPAELLALLDVPLREVEGALPDPERLGSDRDPGVVEGAHRGREPGTRRTDCPRGGNAHIVEVDLTRRRALDAELLLR